MPEKARLIADRLLCLPHLEYTSTAWEQSTGKDINSLKMLQNEAVRFNSGVKGRDGVSDAKQRLGLKQLHEW